MAKERLINTRFWNDGWVRKINPLDRYLFLYFLTNEYTNISGIYELPLKTVAYSTGLDEHVLVKSMFPRLKPKIFYKEGWVIITNFPKHQRLKSESVVLGIKRELELLPKNILKYAIENGYGGDDGGMMGGSSHILNLTKLNLLGEFQENSQGNKKMKNYNENEHSDSDIPTIDNDSRELINSKPQTKKYPNASKVFALFGKHPAFWKINKTQLLSAENLFAERGVEQIMKALHFYKENKDNEFCPNITSPYDLDSKWAKLISFKKKQ